MDKGVLGYDNFDNYNAENLQDVTENETDLTGDRHEEINLFDSKMFKINERYFSTNEEDEIKDSDLIIDDEEINIEISAEDEMYRRGSIKPVLVTLNDRVDTPPMFFDNSFWSKNLGSEEDILKELDLI